MSDYSKIVQSIREAVKVAAATPQRPEGKLRDLVAPLWEEYMRAKKIDLRFDPRDEVILANGRADTVFNRLILEYKKPNVIKPDNGKNRALISQVQGYIEDLSKEERWKEERLLGVAFDGNYFLYVRKVKRWIEEEPEPVTEKSVEKFLLTLEKLTSKAALVPDNLIRDFAVGTDSRNYLAAKTIRAFYSALKDGYVERVKVFFEQWALQFAEVHGAIENKKFDSKTLFESYGFKKQEQKDFDFLAFFFALDTYYAILMKLLAYQVVGFYTLKNISGLPLAEWESLDSDTLRERLNELEEGGIFHQLGIRNFLEGDLLSWYLNDWSDEIEQAIREIITRLNQYDPQTLELLPDETRDIFKKLYQYLVPKQIRHDLGEYYTPDWLADRCLNQLGYGEKVRDLLKLRLLDPGCGSGTFPILAIKRARENARINNISPTETLQLITRNIVGFDLNPLAVIAARTNYLLAIADLLPHRKGEVTIPIYLCDSINPPRAKEQMDLFDTSAGIHTVSTSVGNFRMPNNLIERELIQKTTNLLEECAKKQVSQEKFLQRAHTELKLDDLEILGETYAKLLDLEKKGINGIWARIIKNAFAPLFMGEFDFIAGNPPWVNWEALPQEYRESTAPLWQKYNLFEHTGLRARLGSAKDDISVLMTYVAIDKYLKDKGKICFVITQTIFKTVGGGEGFRRFQLGIGGTHFKIIQVDDIVDLQPFDSATNRTAVFLAQKGEKTEYPVDYMVWKKKEKGSIDLDYSWQEVQEKTIVRYLKAQSIDGSLQGSWISAKPKALKAIKNALGKAAYQGRAGITTWLNGAYWGTITQSENKNLVVFSNLHDVGKTEVESASSEIEADLVFPLLRGREIKRWNITPDTYVILPQDPNQPSKGISRKVFESKYQKCFEYFRKFESQLTNRSGYKKYLEPAGEPFYSLYNIGTYTFMPYKVVWKALASGSVASVLSSTSVGSFQKPTIPDHNIIFVPFENEDEAHYFCALMNTSITSFIITGYVAMFFSAHVLDNIKIPKFDKQNETHVELAHLSEKCHKKTAAGIDVSDLEEQIDNLSAELWGLTKQELIEIKESLQEM
ncbi:MAG: SAM-dependent DNA methyltransferase [Bacteroidia bacterium]|nr:SAM-dependent DNA methyltransferase [Bacteroidia bacterium]